jgi:hypothetical protein
MPDLLRVEHRTTLADEGGFQIHFEAVVTERRGFKDEKRVVALEEVNGSCIVVIGERFPCLGITCIFVEGETA